LDPAFQPCEQQRRQLGAFPDTDNSNDLLEILIESRKVIRCTYCDCQEILLDKITDIHSLTFSVAGLPYLAYKTNECWSLSIEMNPNEGRSLWLLNRT
jgi:hypothetical protein